MEAFTGRTGKYRYIISYTKKFFPRKETRPSFRIKGLAKWRSATKIPFLENNYTQRVGLCIPEDNCRNNTPQGGQTTGRLSVIRTHHRVAP